MDTQSKMVMQFQCFREQTQLLVKETSGRLGKYFFVICSLFVTTLCTLLIELTFLFYFFSAAAEAGFQDISPDVIRKLMAVPIKSSATS